MKLSNKSINKYEPNNDLETAVKEIIVSKIECYDTPEDFFQDLFDHGCISGMISELVYYVDTKKFYNDYSEDIDELLAETEDNIGEPLKMTSPRTNWMAWFGFEETARHIYQECGGENY